MTEQYVEKLQTLIYELTTYSTSFATSRCTSHVEIHSQIVYLKGFIDAIEAKPTPKLSDLAAADLNKIFEDFGKTIVVEIKNLITPPTPPKKK
jgi:hypothetical protein